MGGVEILSTYYTAILTRQMALTSTVEIRSVHKQAKRLTQNDILVLAAIETYYQMDSFLFVHILYV
jgi:hypothetical protein